MKSVLLFSIVIALSLGTALAGPDADLQQKTSSQLRVIAAAQRKEVATGKAALEKANIKIGDLDTYAVRQWERAEDAEKNYKTARRGKISLALKVGAVFGIAGLVIGFVAAPRGTTVVSQPAQMAVQARRRPSRKKVRAR